MNKPYIAAHDIESGAICMKVLETPRNIFIATWDNKGSLPDIGTASEALPKGRVLEIAENVVSLTEDEQIYKVPFTVG